jgi:protein gp37
MGKTSIEWTDASWNPIVGCTEISPGCANCYAARLAAQRLKNTPAYNGLAVPHGPISNAAANIGELAFAKKPRWTGEVRFLPERMEEPLHWRKPRRIFVCDMGDLFHEGVSDEVLDRVFRIMFDAPQHTFQVLTKRASRLRDYMQSRVSDYRYKKAGDWVQLPEAVPRNIWVGVSVENQHFLRERVRTLQQTPAAVRFISAEPLLEDLGDVTPYLCAGVGLISETKWDAIHWVICGPESGPNARPMNLDWARSLRDQCNATDVSFFMKQICERGRRIPFNDFPADLQIREWPDAKR